MAKLSRKAAAEVAEMAGEEVVHVPFEPIPRFDMMLSTGSTLLDCAITGKRIHGGGVPGGILVEIYGPSGKGKTAIAVEIGASAQAMGGTARFNDPEGRLDQEYASMYGLRLQKDNYAASDTVEEVFEDLVKWFAKDLPANKMHVYICDSLAALSTAAEMEGGDKAGMLRAKAFSQMTRRIARLVSNKNRLVVFTNQIRQKPSMGGFGGPTETTPGGEAVKFYASLRMRVGSAVQHNKIIVTKKIRGVEVERPVGINSLVYVAKNSCSSPFMEAQITIIFDYGLDDVRANLEFRKQFEVAEEAAPEDVVEGKSKKMKAYVLGDFKTTRLPNAIKYIEDNDLQRQLRSETIDLWKEIDAYFAVDRKPKLRFYEGD
jgi:recombination protein RecA